jgi:hypothetical protein
MRKLQTKPPLERSTLEAYGGAVLGILGAIVTAWWAKSILLACAAGLLIHAVHRSSWTIRWPRWGKLAGAAAVLVILGLVGGEPIFEDFQKQHPGVFSTAELQDPPDLPPLDLPGPPLSKWGKAMYLCPFPPNTNTRDMAADRAELRKYADIYGRAMGVSVIFTDIPYGLRLDVTANGNEGQQRMNGVQRYTLQFEKSGRGIFVTSQIDLQGGMSVLGLMPVDPGSDVEKAWTKIVEKWVGAAEGTCRLL